MPCGHKPLLSERGFDSFSSVQPFPRAVPDLVLGLCPGSVYMGPCCPSPVSSLLAVECFGDVHCSCLVAITAVWQRVYSRLQTLGLFCAAGLGNYVCHENFSTDKWKPRLVTESAGWLQARLAAGQGVELLQWLEGQNLPGLWDTSGSPAPLPMMAASGSFRSVDFTSVFNLTLWQEKTCFRAASRGGTTRLLWVFLGLRVAIAVQSAKISLSNYCSSPVKAALVSKESTYFVPKL